MEFLLEGLGFEFILGILFLYWGFALNGSWMEFGSLKFKTIVEGSELEGETGFETGFETGCKAGSARCGKLVLPNDLR